MKKFIHNLFLFARAVAIILVLSIVFYCFMFKTPQTNRIPFLGDSTGKATINPKIATRYENLTGRRGLSFHLFQVETTYKHTKSGYCSY